MTVLWNDIGANLVGSFFGVGLAFFADRWNEARLRRERSTKRQREAEELEAGQLRIVQWVVEENVELARQAIAAIDANGLFFFRMNTHLLDAALIQLSATSNDQTLLWHSEHFRFQLHHINEKLAAWRSAALYQGDPTGAALTFMNGQVLPSIRKQFEDMILLKASDLLPLLRTRIQSLSRIQLPPIRPPMPPPGDNFPGSISLQKDGS